MYVDLLQVEATLQPDNVTSTNAHERQTLKETEQKHWQPACPFLGFLVADHRTPVHAPWAVFTFSPAAGSVGNEPSSWRPSECPTCPQASVPRRLVLGAEAVQLSLEIQVALLEIGTMQHVVAFSRVPLVLLFGCKPDVILQ